MSNLCTVNAVALNFREEFCYKKCNPLTGEEIKEDIVIEVEELNKIKVLTGLTDEDLKVKYL